MQKIIKWGIIPLLFLITVLLVKSYLQNKSSNSRSDKIEQIKQDSTCYYRDLYYTEHATREVIEADLAAVQAHYGATMDSIKKRTDIKDKDIQAITTLSTVAAGTIIPAVDTLPSLDSAVTFRLSYQDDWLKLHGEISRTPTISYLVKDSIIFTTYQKRTGLFKKDTYLDGYSLNPAVHIAGITAIRITSENPQRVGIGPYLGYGWNGVKWAPSAGISIHYSLVKF